MQLDASLSGQLHMSMESYGLRIIGEGASIQLHIYVAPKSKRPVAAAKPDVQNSS